MPFKTPKTKNLTNLVIILKELQTKFYTITPAKATHCISNHNKMLILFKVLSYRELSIEQILLNLSIFDPTNKPLN